MAIKGTATRRIHFAHIAEDGKPGASAMPPRLWTDYPDGYSFKSGIAGEGARIDVVLMPNSKSPGEYIAYYCKENHLKTEARKPGDGVSNTWWGMMDGSFTLIATKILLAQQAFIRNLIAGHIIMTDDDGNEIFVAADGKVLCNTGVFKNVQVSGDITAGDPDGKHIHLDPEDKAIRIFDASGNECATIDGSSYTSTSVLPAAPLTLTVDPTGRQTLSVDATKSDLTVKKSATATNLTAQVAQPGKIKVTLNAQLSLTPAPTVNGQRTTGNGQLEMSDTAVPQRNAIAALYCVIDTLDSAGTKTLRSTRVCVMSLTPWFNPDGTISGDTTGGDRTFTVAVPVGRHRISLSLEASGCTSSASYTLNLAQIVQDSFMSRHFANGFALTRDTLSYLLALYESGAFKLMLGGDLYIDKVKQPRVVYAARVTDSGTASVKQFVALATPTFSRLTETGQYRFVFPASFGLTADNTFVTATGYGDIVGGGSHPVKATVKTLTAASGALTIDIWISDDDTPNYGGFYLEVKKY